MSNIDPLKEIIEGLEPVEAKKASDKRVQEVSKNAQAKQSQADLVDFGFVKIWTAILEIFSVFYVQTQERKNEIEKSLEKKVKTKNKPEQETK